MDHSNSLFGFPERLKGWQGILPYALLASVSFAVYGGSLYYDFQWDDAFYVADNIRIRGLSLPYLQVIWSDPYVGHYAPIHQTVLAVLYYFFELEPFGYHVAQLLLHAACLGLLFLTLQELESARVALLATLLLAVHPTNIENVAWISETKSILAFLFFLLSFWFFRRLRERERRSDAILCGLFLILSLLSKINTVVAPAIFLLYDYRQALPFNRKRIASLAGFFLIAVTFVVIHVTSFFWGDAPLAQNSLGGTYYGGLGVHLQNIPFFLWFYVRMTFFPHPLTIWHMFPVHEQMDWMVVGAWIAVLAVCLLLLRRDRNTQFWCLWFVVFLAPVLQIIPNLTWVAERYLYIPVIGIFVLVGRLFFRLWDRLPRPGLRWGWEFAMVFVLLILAWRTEVRLPTFQNNVTLWEDTVQSCQTSAPCHAGLGYSLLEDRQVERGVREIIRAVEIRPLPRYLSMLGDAYTVHVGDYRQAIIAYQMAMNGEHSSVKKEVLHAQIARAHVMAGNLEEAGRSIQASRAINPDSPFLLVVDAFYEWQRGNLQPARQSLLRALSLTHQTNAIGKFLYVYWGNAADAGRLLADLRPQPSEIAAQ